MTRIKCNRYRGRRRQTFLSCATAAAAPICIRLFSVTLVWRHVAAFVGPMTTSAACHHRLLYPTQVAQPRVTERQQRLFMATDYYEILGVKPDCDMDTLKKAYRNQARKLNPDLNEDETARAKFDAVTQAYDVLSHPETREMYDVYGEEGLASGAAGVDFNTIADTIFNARTRPKTETEEMEEGGPDAGVGLNDMFETFFDSKSKLNDERRAEDDKTTKKGGKPIGPPPAQQGRPTQEAATAAPPPPPQTSWGADFEVWLAIPFKAAVFGGEGKITLTRMEACDACSGTGLPLGSSRTRTRTTCVECKGTGKIKEVQPTSLGYIQRPVTCPRCKGDGEEPLTSACSACGGEGVLEQTRTVIVDIPGGVEEGVQLKVVGEGDAGRRGGPSGDLYVNLKVLEHPEYTRNGPDIGSEITVDYLDAILGKPELEVDVLEEAEEGDSDQNSDGNAAGKAIIAIPAGAQHDSTVRIPGKGAYVLDDPSGTARGDHVAIIRLKLPFPEELSEEERELLEAWRRKEVERKGTITVPRT